MQHHSGFTLIELIIALAVLAILLSMAAPAMHDFQQRQKVVSTANELLAHIHLARTHAVSRRQITIVCPSSNGQTCSNANRWEQGWIVFRDADRSGQPESAAEILRIGAGMDGLLIDSAGRTHIRYQPEGTAGGSNLTIKLCDPNNADNARAVIVSNPGRPRVDELPNHLTC
ncbi:MAG: Tfp pilus assembly protein FimT/FimU [Pseudomonadota bacterium]